MDAGRPSGRGVLAGEVGVGQAGVRVGWVQEGQAGVAHLWVGWVQESQAGVAGQAQGSGVAAEESPAPLRHDRFTNVNNFVRHMSLAPQHSSPLTHP